MPSKILTITYTGSILGQGTINPSSWDVYGVTYDRGFPVFKPQLELEVLQPFAVDGARYRVGGLHYETFKMMVVIPSADYFSAAADARNIEQLKGDTIAIKYEQSANTTYPFYVIDCKAVPNAKRIIGVKVASQGTISDDFDWNPVNQDADASIDVMLTLQGYVP